MAQKHAKPASAIQKLDPVWGKIRTEAEDVVRREPEIGTRWCIGSASGSTTPTCRPN